MPVRIARGVEETAKGARKHRRQHHLSTVARRKRGQGENVLHLITLSLQKKPRWSASNYHAASDGPNGNKVTRIKLERPGLMVARAPKVESRAKEVPSGRPKIAQRFIAGTTS